MGNSQPQEAAFLLDSRSMQDWVKVQEQGYCELWMNKKTSKQVQAYPIPQSFVRNKDQLHKYNFRKAHRQNLVVVESIVTPGNSSFCSQPRTAYALVQNIKGRLSQFKRCLSLEQALYVLSAAASGYNTLNSFFGPLEPHAEMICFNEQGAVKIWLNENLAMNEPSQAAKPQNNPNDDYNAAQSRTKEGVHKLIKIVEQAAINQFKYPFSEECKKLETYFQTANMVSYFCYANNIQLPSKVIIYKHLQNPTINSQKNMKQQQVTPNIQTNQGSLESSRVKAVLYRSSQVQQRQQQIMNSAVARSLFPEAPIQINSGSRVSQKTIQSPKITFSIRSSLPAQLSQQKVQGVLFGKPIFKTTNLNPTVVPSSFESIIRSTHEQLKVQIQQQEKIKNSTFSQKETTNLSSKIQEKQQAESIITQSKTLQTLHNYKASEINEENNQTTDKVKNKQTQLMLTNPIKQQKSYMKEQIPKAIVVDNKPKESAEQHIYSYQQTKSNGYLKDDQEVKFNEQYVSNENTIMKTAYFATRKNEPKYLDWQNDYRNQHYQQKEQPTISKQNKVKTKSSAIDDLKTFDQDYTEKYGFQNHLQVDKKWKQVQEQTSGLQGMGKNQIYQVQKQEKKAIRESTIENSTHSNIQKHISPSTHYLYQQSPIIQQLQENLSSPAKDNTQIQEWQARLTKFTQSVHSHHNDHGTIIFQKEKIPEKVQTPLFQSKRQVVCQQKPSHELANLDQYGIEEYIRKKYNLYTDSAPQVQKQRNHQTSKRIESNYRTSFRNQPQRFSYDYANTKEQAILPQKRTSYKSNRLEENNEQWRSRQYNKDSYQKQNYYPTYQDYSYPQNNRPGIQLYQYQVHPQHQIYPENVEERYSKIEAEKPKARPSQMSKIDQRYNKYVLNANRSKPTVNNSISKDVSLILGEQSKISCFSPKLAFMQLEESLKRGQSTFGQGYSPFPIHKNEVTYEKLRNLLWEE